MSECPPGLPPPPHAAQPPRPASWACPPHTLVHVGEQDITAHVDFTAVAEAADRAGLAVSGYTSQAAFLLGCGIEQMLEGMAQKQDAAWFALVEGFKRLVLPTEMGERFRVMALTKGLQTAPEGFAQDMRFRL